MGWAGSGGGWGFVVGWGGVVLRSPPNPFSHFFRADPAPFCIQKSSHSFGEQTGPKGLASGCVSACRSVGLCAWRWIVRVCAFVCVCVCVWRWDVRVKKGRFVCVCVRACVCACDPFPEHDRTPERYT